MPLAAGDQQMGALVLADRVSGASYTSEELELLKSITDHVASVLLNIRLANEVVQAREMEAFVYVLVCLSPAMAASLLMLAAKGPISTRDVVVLVGSALAQFIAQNGAQRGEASSGAAEATELSHA